MIVVSGTITIDPADRDAALDLAATLVEATLAEPGCVTYGFYPDPTDAGTLRVFEEWQDDEALGSHFGEPHMAAFMAGLGELKVTGTAISKYVVSDKSKLM